MLRTLMVLAAFLAPGLAQAAAPATPFDPAKDYETTAMCYAVFLSLTPTFFTGTPAELAALNVRGFRGYNRMKPYIEKASEWAPAFEGRALEYHRGWDQAITALGNQNDKLRIRMQMLAVATYCETRMDGWGAPAFTGNPPGF